MPARMPVLEQRRSSCRGAISDPCCASSFSFQQPKESGTKGRSCASMRPRHSCVLHIKRAAHLRCNPRSGIICWARFDSSSMTQTNLSHKSCALNPKNNASTRQRRKGNGCHSERSLTQARQMKNIRPASAQTRRSD